MMYRNIGYQVAILGVLIGVGTSVSAAMTASAPQSAMATQVLSGPLAQPLSWAQLSPERRTALEPLKAHWAEMSSTSQKKWLVVADRFYVMNRLEQQRVQARMKDWVNISPVDKEKARLRYQTAKAQLNSQERQQQWQAYQSLPEIEKKQLTASALAKQKPGSGANLKAKDLTNLNKKTIVPKSNIVGSVLQGQRLKVVAPAIVQASPGLTTQLINKKQSRPAPHLQPGLPKITATEAFVDPVTLLPRVGPQAAKSSHAY